MREKLHLDSVSMNYAKRTLRYKASKIWNELPSSLVEFSSLKYFSNKLKQFPQVVDIDDVFSVWLWPCSFVFFLNIGLSVLPCEKFSLSISCLVWLSVFSSVCLLLFSSVIVFANFRTLCDQVRWAFAFLVARHYSRFICSIHYSILMKVKNVPKSGPFLKVYKYNSCI